MAHLNLVLIDPFSDGNGRTAPCLPTLVLARDGVLAPQLSRVEEYFGANTEAVTSVRHGDRALGGHGVSSVDDAVAEEAERLLDFEGSVGVICADVAVDGLTETLSAAGLDPEVLTDAAAGPRLSVVPATLAKGLEFDSVLVVEPADIVAAEPRGLNRLYVVLTRAVSRLVVIHADPLPAELAPRR
ncbi:MAG: hypothetical protein H0V67_07985 [Geodermatophilaceae bacterium]|nr:hypothetical protein [Geodermatophilaceae bacterium]